MTIEIMRTTIPKKNNPIPAKTGLPLLLLYLKNIITLLSRDM